MDSHSSSERKSDPHGSQNPELNPPPPYHQNSSPVLLAETRTTKTEVVTTTTTETTTHLFPLPYWRKKNTVQFPVSQRSSIEDAPPISPFSSPPAILSFVDKALPPTPPPESDSILGKPTMPSLSTASSSRSRLKSSTGPQSAVVLAHASLGLGLPHASTSFSRPQARPETPTTLVSSPQSSLIASPGLRRAKSSYRVQPRHLSEDHERIGDKEHHLIERRQRGLSFGTISFLNLTNDKGKGKTSENNFPLSDSLATPAKPLSRKSSFWNRKKTIPTVDTIAPTHVVNGSIVVLPSLPPVHHVSPFNIPNFSENTFIHKGEPISSPSLSRSHSQGFRPSDPVTASNEPVTNRSASPTPVEELSEDNSTSNKVYTAIQASNEGSGPSHRPRRQTSTPLLHRLSMSVFSLGESSSSMSASHSPSTVRSPSFHVPLRKVDAPIPKPLSGEEESPEVYLVRLKAAVSKAEIAGILASSIDPFYAAALQAYINQFDFTDIALDIALRKLLMEVGLPRETQQIDRVIEAFAERYTQCNPNIFTSEDHPYILAFSLIMLHTDAFNPSNKRKMTKADYIKNTKLPGIPVEVLDCFYDNIIFAPFIFIEDPVDFNGQTGLLPEISRPITLSTPTSAISLNGSATFRINNKIDPYYLIINNMLESLRVDVNAYILPENPYTYQGTNGSWDESELHQAFVNASVINIDIPLTSRTPLFSPSSKPNPFNNTDNSQPADGSENDSKSWTMKLTKIGLLNRKNDVSEGGRRSSNRKWKTWSVILTGSQLLFFRDAVWASALTNTSECVPENALGTPTSIFRPDESFSTKDAVAVYDRSYTKYQHTMRFILPDGRQLLLQATNNKDLNEWISRINYASAFKSAGVKIRPPGLSNEDILLTGVAAATSHLHDLQTHTNVLRQRSWDSTTPNELMDMLSGPSSSRSPIQRRVTMTGVGSEFEVEVPVAPEIDGAEQFKATFDQVKADLSLTSLDDELDTQDAVAKKAHDSPIASPLSFDSNRSRFATRSQIIQSKIRDLNAKIAVSQSQLDSDTRYVRNISILSPFQKSTRGRLTTAVQNIGKRVMQVRLELEKLQCHRDVLCQDLTSEDQSWKDSKQVALRAAKESLQNRYPFARAQNVPKMTLSLFGREPLSTEDIDQFTKAPTSPRPSSSGSFHSAMESGYGWPSSDDIAFLSASHDSSNIARSGSKSSFHSASSPKGTQRSSRSSLSFDSHHQGLSEPNVEGAGGDDLAEDWNKTRGAKRVSLIQVPADIKLSDRFKKINDNRA